MKSIVIFLVFLILTQGKVEAQSTSEGLQMEDMPWNISKAVEGYYYTYFEYPHNIEDIECYLWSVINNILTCYVIEPINECEVTNSQYQDFVTCGHSFINTLKYLKYNEKYIIIENKNNSFDLRCLRDGLSVNYTADICWDLSNFLKSMLFRRDQRIFFYNENKKIIENSEYESVLTQRIRDTRDFYYRNYSEEDKRKGRTQYILIRYTKGEKRFKSLCLSGKEFLKHGYLKEIFKVLDVYFKDKNVYSTVLLLPIPIPEKDFY